MKTAVVYYSLEGNSQYAAIKIAENLKADLIQLEVVKPFPSKGFGKFLFGGKSAVSEEKPVLKPYEFHPEEYSTIVLACPVWASNIATPIRTFIAENAESLKDKKIASVLCFLGSGAGKAQQKLKTCLGIETFATELVLVDPLRKKNTENDERIVEFCNKLKGKEQI